MSDFLGYEDGTIPLASSIEQMKNAIRSLFTGFGWQVIRESISGTALNGSGGCQDDDHGSGAYSGTIGANTWVGFLADAPFTPTRMMLLGGVTNSSQTPKSWVLEYSDDGGNSWSAQQTWTNQNLAYGETAFYSISGASSHAAWRIRPTATYSGGTAVQINGWWLENASGWKTYPGALLVDLTLPSGETVGNATSREFVRMYFAGSTISVRCLQELLVDIPFSGYADAAVAGAVTLSLTIGGSTVSYTGSSGNSSAKNARGLFEAIKASSDANFTAWAWYWWNGGIVGKRSAYAQGTPTVTSSNITWSNWSVPRPASVQTGGIVTASVLNVDLVSGFVYYFQCNKRGFALATKTNAGFSGPVHVVFAENVDAVAAVPGHDPVFLPPCTPIEAIWGVDDTGTAVANSSGWVTHWFGISSAISKAPYFPDYSQYTYATVSNRWTHQQNNIAPMDVFGSGSGYATALADRPISMVGEGFFSASDGAGGYSVHRLMPQPKSDYTASAPLTPARWLFPGANTKDWYRYVGTAADEQQLLCAHPDVTTQLTANIDNVVTSIPVNSTSAFPSSGHIVIDGEVISYSSKTSNAFNGCARGQMGTFAEAHYNLDKCYVGGWFVKIGQGLLFAGFTQPS